MCASSKSTTARLLSWIAWSGRPRSSLSQETPCCSRRAAHPWTCSRTTALAGMPSRSRSAACANGEPTGSPRPALPRPSRKGPVTTPVTSPAGEQHRAAPAPEKAVGWFGRPRHWIRHSIGHSLGHALDRPLTSYYLLLSASTLLLTIGLMEVLSASSVDGYLKHGNSYSWFLRQLPWLLLALPVAFVASRLPPRVLRFFAWPGLLVAVTLLALTRPASV